MSASTLSESDKEAAFANFKKICAEEGLLEDHSNSSGDDITTGISDDGTLLRVIPDQLEFGVSLFH